MKARVLVLSLLAAAAALHLLVTVPLQRQAAGDGDAYRRHRDERRQAQGRLARLQRGEALRRQASRALGAAGDDDVVRTVRRSVVGSLEGAGVSRVRVAVRPGGREQVAATVTLNAEGGFADVVRLSSHVVRAGSGLLLQSVTLGARDPRVNLTVEALGPRGSS